MPFSIIRNDITKLKTDAIVNAANERLLAGGGVCGAIFSAAGADKLQRECTKIGFCQIGDAVITDGYNLSAKYIIHAVGPIYGVNPKKEEQQLYSCYERSLEIAKEKGLKSIAFPLISSGIYGYPRTEALKIATKAIKNFLLKNEMDIYLVVYDSKSFEISKMLFDSVQSFINERLVRATGIGRILPSTCMIGAVSASVDATDNAYSEKQCCAPEADFKVNKKRSLRDLFQNDSETFSEMLMRIIDEKGLTDVSVYKRANIDRKLFSKIRGKNYTPRKNTVIALAISLKLNLNQTTELLKRAGYALSECDKFDIIIEYFIENEQYDIYEINETLFCFDQKLLGV